MTTINNFVQIGDACVSRSEIEYFVKIDQSSSFFIDIIFDDENSSFKRLNFNNETLRNLAFDTAVTSLAVPI